MDLEFLWLIGRTLGLSKTEPEKDIGFACWEKCVIYFFYKEQKGISPKTREEKEEAVFLHREKREREIEYLQKLPKEILGKDVDWDRVRVGYLTQSQRERLEEYCKRIR